MIYLIGRIEFTWPSEIEWLIKAQNFIVTVTRGLLKADCYIMRWYDEPPNLQIVYINNIVQTLQPILIVVLSYIFWKFIIYGLSAKDRQDKHFATVSIVFFFFYPLTVTNLAESLLCTEIEGVYRLDIDPT